MKRSKLAFAQLRVSVVLLGAAAFVGATANRLSAATSARDASCQSCDVNAERTSVECNSGAGSSSSQSYTNCHVESANMCDITYSGSCPSGCAGDCSQMLGGDDDGPSLSPLSLTADGSVASLMGLSGPKAGEDLLRACFGFVVARGRAPDSLGVLRAGKLVL